MTLLAELLAAMQIQPIGKGGPQSYRLFPVDRGKLFSPFPLEDSMEEQREYAILFAATILAARKLNESGCTCQGHLA